MAREFRLPDIGEGLTEAEIVRWLVAEGDRVEADQPLVEVETDKAVVEIPSPYAGVVVAHGGAEGETIEVGDVLVTIGETGETGETAAAQAPMAQSGDNTFSVDEDMPESAPRGRPEPQTWQGGSSSPDVTPIVGTLIEDPETIVARSETSTPRSAVVKALPIVRKLARDNGIDLETVTGSGPGGRITREDIDAEIETRATSSAVSPTTPVAPGPSRDGGGDDVPPTGDETSARRGDVASSVGDERTSMTRLRRTIAANMSKSWEEIPHVTTFDDIDATRLFEVRDALSTRHGERIPIEALVVKAVLPALSRFPEFNASLDGADLVFHRRHDIGIAVDTPDGLLVAVIKDADSRGVLDLAVEVRRLGEGARQRSLSPDELTGQTFTVSNIGAVGGGHGTPIVPYGTTAILSVGRARLRPIVDSGDLVIAPVMPLSLSYDHRIVDGAKGRRFMSLVMENLEEPALFLA